ncbi:hypothetical protein Tco_1380049 [Tanacetum coccineum]
MITSTMEIPWSSIGRSKSRENGHNKASCKKDPQPKPEIEKKPPGRNKQVFVGQCASRGGGRFGRGDDNDGRGSGSGVNAGSSSGVTDGSGSGGRGGGRAGGSGGRVVVELVEVVKGVVEGLAEVMREVADVVYFQAQVAMGF